MVKLIIAAWKLLMFSIEGRVCVAEMNQSPVTCSVAGTQPLKQVAFHCFNAVVLFKVTSPLYEKTFRPSLFQSVPCPTALAVAGVPSADLILDSQSLTPTHQGDTSVNSDHRPVHHLQEAKSRSKHNITKLKSDTIR